MQSATVTQSQRRLRAEESPQDLRHRQGLHASGQPAPSNTDPFAETPPAGADWMKDGPHVMVIASDPALSDAFPGQHTANGPYVMYKGTPYAHLMVPVQPR